MTREEAIKQLKKQIKPNAPIASIEAISMAVEALEKENEPAPSANDTSSMCIKKDNFNNNDTSELKKCQEAIITALDALAEIFGDMDDSQQEAWSLGKAYGRLLGAQQIIEEDKQC